MSSSNLLMQDVTVSSRSFFNFHSTFRGYPLALHSKVTLSPGFALTIFFLSLSLINGSTRIKVYSDNDDVLTTTTMMIILMMIMMTMMGIRRMFLPKMSKNIVGFPLTDLEKLLHFLDRLSPLRRGNGLVFNKCINKVENQGKTRLSDGQPDWDQYDMFPSA